MTPLKLTQTIRVWDRKRRSDVAVVVDLNIDVENIARELGQRAYSNKSGRFALAIGVAAKVWPIKT